MSSVQSYIDTRAARYSADARLPELQAQAELEVGTVFGSLRYKAVALLMLHWLTMDDRDSGGLGVGGAISMEREGSLQRQYLLDFSVTKQNPDLAQTKWGLEYVQLKKSCIIKPMTRFCT